jgi:hypothetical protein
VVDTIAGWSLQYSAAYPAILGLTDFIPGVSGEWADVYNGMISLLDNDVIRDVIRRSYSSLNVDEYGGVSSRSTRL